MWPRLGMREGEVMTGGGNLQAMTEDLIIGPALMFCTEVKLPKLIEDLTVLTKIGDLINIRDPLITGERSLDIRTELKRLVITDDLKVLDIREGNVQITKKDLAIGEKVQALKDSLVQEVIILNILDLKSPSSEVQVLTIDPEEIVHLTVVSLTQEVIPEVKEGPREGKVTTQGVGQVLLCLLPDQGSLKPMPNIKP